MIHAESILAVTGSLGSGHSGVSNLLKSPGQLPKHYSPKARLVLWSWSNEKDLDRQLRAFRGTGFDGQVETSHCHIITHTQVPLNGTFGRVSVIPHDSEAFARAIYGELHRCDEEGARLIIVERLPETADWQAISDRLNRAAAS